MKEINQDPQDSLVNHVECVQAVLTKSQQKGKGPIQHLGDLEVKGQLNPIMGTSNPGLKMGLLLSIRPELVVHLNEVLITQASVPCRVVPFSTHV